MSNIFKVNNKDTRTTSMTYLTPCTSVSVVNVEPVISGCVVLPHKQV